MSKQGNNTQNVTKFRFLSESMLFHSRCMPNRFQFKLRRIFSSFRTEIGRPFQSITRNNFTPPNNQDFQGLVDQAIAFVDSSQNSAESWTNEFPKSKFHRYKFNCLIIRNGKQAKRHRFDVAKQKEDAMGAKCRIERNVINSF